MNVSIIIASHNEGARLAKTVESCRASSGNLDFEVVVADDASTDGSVDRVLGLPRVRIVQNAVCQGVAAAKDLGARRATGNVLIFLDAHCKPEAGAIERMAADVNLLNGLAVVGPRVAALEESDWENRLDQCGNGYALDLETFEEQWVPLRTLRRYRQFYLSPNLAGCCFAVSRNLYRELGGFDIGMKVWGCEQVDFGLKAWLLGYRIVNDIDAVIGHRFRANDDDEPSTPQLLANQMRTARRHLSDEVWDRWLAVFRRRPTAETWSQAWALFERDRDSLETERRHLHRTRLRDEFWYADEFGFEWPLNLGAESSGLTAYRRQLREQYRSRTNRPFNIEATGLLGGSRGPDGSLLQIALKIGSQLWGGPYIEEASCECQGSELMAIYGNLLVDSISGKTLESLRDLSAAHLVGRLGGPEGELDAAARALDAFRDALGTETGRQPPSPASLRSGS